MDCGLREFACKSGRRVIHIISVSISYYVRQLKLSCKHLAADCSFVQGLQGFGRIGKHDLQQVDGNFPIWLMTDKKILHLTRIGEGGSAGGLDPEASFASAARTLRSGFCKVWRCLLEGV